MNKSTAQTKYKKLPKSVIEKEELVENVAYDIKLDKTNIETQIRNSLYVLFTFDLNRLETISHKEIAIKAICSFEVRKKDENKG